MAIIVWMAQVQHINIPVQLVHLQTKLDSNRLLSVEAVQQGTFVRALVLLLHQDCVVLGSSALLVQHQLLHQKVFVLEDVSV